MTQQEEHAPLEKAIREAVSPAEREVLQRELRELERDMRDEEAFKQQAREFYQ